MFNNFVKIQNYVNNCIMYVVKTIEKGCQRFIFIGSETNV